MRTLARRADKEELFRRIRSLRPDSPRRWGRMSAHHMVCHLSDACRMATGQKAVTPSTSVTKRTIVKWIALYVPLRWPPGIPTSPEIDQQGGGRAPAEFAADVEDLLAQMEAIARDPRALEGRVHPIFGRISSRGWLRWAYLHADHHLRQFGA
jgi:hypothetical protein